MVKIIDPIAWIKYYLATAPSATELGAFQAMEQFAREQHATYRYPLNVEQLSRIDFRPHNR